MVAAIATDFRQERSSFFCQSKKPAHTHNHPERKSIRKRKNKEKKEWFNYDIPALLILRMSFSSSFFQPLLIYDDKCSSCAKFARTAAKLSRGWIRIAGHYYSQEAIDSKKAIFPPGYDATKMFWLINRKGAYGARLGLIQVVKEIALGIFKSAFSAQHKKNSKCYNKNGGGSTISSSSNETAENCSYSDKESCMSTKSTLSRVFSMMKNGDRVKF